MALTGYPPEDLVFRESFRSASVRARDELARALAEAGLGELAVIVGYVDSAGGPRNACARAPPRRGRGHLLQAPPAQLRRLRRGALLRARRPVRGRPDPRRRRRADDLRGPLAGRRPVRGRRPGRGRAGQLHQRLAVRAEQGRRAAAAGGAGGRPRPARPIAYVNMVGAQDELVFDGDSLVVTPAGDGARPGRAVHRGAARRPRPRAARRPRHGDRPGARHDGRAARRSRTSRLRPGRRCRRPARRASGWSTRRRSGGRWSPAPATTSARTASARSSSACPAASTPRVTAVIAADALGPDAVHGVSMPIVVLVRALAGATRPTWPGGSASTSAPCRSRRWSRPTCPR